MCAPSSSLFTYLRRYDERSKSHQSCCSCRYVCQSLAYYLSGIYKILSGQLKPLFVIGIFFGRILYRKIAWTILCSLGWIPAPYSALLNHGISAARCYANGLIVPSDGLELAKNYIRWPTTKQGQLQASQAKISGFSIWWPVVKITSSLVHNWIENVKIMRESTNKK